MKVLTNPEEAQLFVDLLTHNKDIPDNLLPLSNFYNGIKVRVRVSGEKITDIFTMKKRFYSLTQGLPEEDYNKMLGQLAMYEFTINYRDWPEFHTSKERRSIEIKKLKDIVYSVSEKSHFSEEFEILGDQADDILGSSTLALMPLEEIRKRIKNKRIIKEPK